MFRSHSKNGFYTVRSNYYEARIITIKETLIQSSNGAYASVVKDLEIYTVFGSQHIHVSNFHSHNSQLTILNSIHNSLSFSFSFFFFLILTQILVWNPNFELSFWFVKSKLNKTQTMGTMSKRLPNTHISSTHKPNKEKKKAKVKREREE